MDTYAVIGDPVGHSLSPAIHNAVFRHAGMDCTYMAYRIPRDELEYGITALKRIKIAGFNVTIPHKISVMEYLDAADDNCRSVGACNTVSAGEDGSLRGYNTDVDGFMDPIRRRDISVKGFKVLILGAGGAARAATAGLARGGMKSVTICGRTRYRTASLADLAASLKVSSKCITTDAQEELSEYSMVVNATPIGMGGEETPLRIDTINPDCIVYDMVYRPMKTDLIARAQGMNATCIYGYEMLLGQAVRSFEIWHGTKAPYDIMKRAVLGGF